MNVNFVVADVPLTATPEETARLLNDSCAPGFRVLSIVPWAAHGVGVRVFLGRRIPNPHKGRQRNRDGKEQQAIALVEENPGMSTRNVVRFLREHGIQRGKDWVATQRANRRNG